MLSLHVTDVLARFYRGQVDPFYLERGLAVHRATELSDIGTLDESTVDPLIVPYLEGWRKFRRECPWEIIDIEERVQFYLYGGVIAPLRMSDAVRILGKVDRVMLRRVRRRGRQVVLDIKTGSRHPAHALQTAAYLHGLTRGKIIRNDYDGDRYTVLLDGEGGYNLVQHGARSQRHDYAMFQAAAMVMAWEVTHGLVEAPAPREGDEINHARTTRRIVQ